MATPIRLVAGLGNPGPRYADTRHNAGFWFVDALAERCGGRFRPMARCFGSACEVRVAESAVRLFKPSTFMNDSGRAIAAVTRYYGCEPRELLIAHDEIDLPAGTVRLKRGGGHGGHNGLRDIIPHLGDPGFSRVRFGVGHPGHKEAVAGHVLKRASAADREIVEDAIERVLDEIGDILTGRLDRAMNVLHRRAEPDDAPDD